MQWLWQEKYRQCLIFYFMCRRCLISCWVESTWIETSCFKHVLIEHEGVCLRKRRKVLERERERERWNDNVEQMYLMKCKWNCFHYNWEEIWASLRHGSFMTCIDFLECDEIASLGQEGKLFSKNNVTGKNDKERETWKCNRKERFV